MTSAAVALQSGDALIMVDVQNDFLPGGRLAVPEGDAVVQPLNRYSELFSQLDLPVIATRDWHPQDHCSFAAQGGTWPAHCVQQTAGAEFSSALHLPEGAVVISKASTAEEDAYSGFERTDLHERLQKLGVSRLFIGGLATDYCVLETVRSALTHGYEVFWLRDASRAVNVRPDDGQNAAQEMIRLGAKPLEWHQLA